MGRRANGEGSIYQRKDGRWAASISVGGIKRKHFLGRTRAEVAAKLTEALNGQHKGIPIVSSNQNVSQYLTFWLSSTKASVRPKTHESYDLNVRRLTALIGKTRLNSLSPASVERAYAELQSGGLSSRSVVQAHTVLHNALKKAVQWGLLGRNPTEAVSVPRAERHEMKTLGEGQVRLLFEATREDPLHALWVLLTTSGLRLGEALGLRWDDIDFPNHRLMVRRALQRQKGNGLVFVEPKTARSRRTVYFPDGTGEVLHAHRVIQLEKRFRLGDLWKDQNLVFPKEGGSPLDPTQVSQKLHRILAKAELPQISESPRV